MRTCLQRALPLAEWPEADRQAWLNLTGSRPGPLDEGDGIALSPVTLQDLRCRYAYYLNYVRDHDHLESHGVTAGCIAESSVRDYIAWLAPRVSSVTLAGSIRKLLRVAELLAPHRDWGWLRHFARQLEARMQRRDRQAEVVEARRLYCLGLTLMRSAETAACAPQVQARLYRDGLIIGMLAALAPRLGDFVGLEIGRTISCTGSLWVVHFEGRRHSKYRRPTDKPLPSSLSPHIERWIAEYRPRFPDAERHQRLWPSRNGILTPSRARQIISSHTRRAFGRRVNPHLFRACVASSISDERGADLHLGSAVLDHVDPRTTAKHYNHARMADAVAAYQRRLGLVK